MLWISKETFSFPEQFSLSSLKAEDRHQQRNRQITLPKTDSRVNNGATKKMQKKLELEAPS